jgi:hypothetical protein
MKRSGLVAVAPLLLLVLSPASVSAQSAAGVGVVTTLSGQATVARAALPQPRPLRFKDDVFEKDRISTAEKSIVRVLLAGKALVTVRELSALTVTEQAGRSTVELASGKIAVGVARQRMRPGEVIEIRTPNAVAAVRGTVLVVEIIQASASSHGGPTPATTNVHVLRGRVDVFHPNDPGAPPVQVGSMETLSRIGSAPAQLRPLTSEAAERLLADLRSEPQFTQGPDEFQDDMDAREQSRALALALAIAPALGGGESDGGGGGPGANGGAPSRPAGDDNRDACSLGACAAGGGSGSSGPAKSGRAVTTYNNQNNPVVNVVGDFYSVPNTSNIALSQPLLETTASTLTIGGSLIDVKGTLAANDATNPFVYLDPTITTLKNLIKLSGGGVFTAANIIIKDLGSPALTVTGDGLVVTGNSSLTTTGAVPAVALDGSTMTVSGDVLAESGAKSALTLKGGLLDQTNGAVVTAQRLAGVNAALLDASAPLLNLIRNSAFTSLVDAVDLASVNPATQFPALAKLDSSTFTVKTGAALNLSGNSTVSVGADLFTLANKSTLTILNGVLLSLSGNSTLSITGALLNFVGTGNTVLVTNSLCGGPCPMIAGIPVFITGGASVTLTNPFKNAAGNTITYSSPSAALISVSGAKSSVTVLGK